MSVEDIKLIGVYMPVEISSNSIFEPAWDIHENICMTQCIVHYTCKPSYEILQTRIACRGYHCWVCGPVCALSVPSSLILTIDHQAIVAC